MELEIGLGSSLVAIVAYLLYCGWRKRTVFSDHLLLIIIAAFILGESIARDALPLAKVIKFVYDYKGHLALVAHEGKKTIPADLSSSDIEAVVGVAALGAIIVLLSGWLEYLRRSRESQPHDPPTSPTSQTPTAPAPQPRQTPAAPSLPPAPEQMAQTTPRPQRQPQPAQSKRRRRR